MIHVPAAADMNTIMKNLTMNKKFTFMNTATMTIAPADMSMATNTLITIMRLTAMNTATVMIAPANMSITMNITMNTLILRLRFRLILNLSLMSFI